MSPVIINLTLFILEVLLSKPSNALQNSEMVPEWGLYIALT